MVPDTQHTQLGLFYTQSVIIFGYQQAAQLMKSFTVFIEVSQLINPLLFSVQLTCGSLRLQIVTIVEVATL